MQVTLIIPNQNIFSVLTYVSISIPPYVSPICSGVYNKYMCDENLNLNARLLISLKKINFLFRMMGYKKS